MNFNILKGETKMKKLLSLLLAIFMMFSLVACGGGADDGDKPSSTPVVNNDDVDDSGEELELDGHYEYVVCVRVGSDLTINSIKDINGLKVGASRNTDGEKIARYYGGNVVLFGGDNDAFSDLASGTSVECVIVEKSAAENYTGRGLAEYALNPIVIE